jgi:hypothetical protein
MVHYAMCASPNKDGQFKTFLLMNPQMANGGLFLHYYSKQRMLLSAEARTSVLLPDITPLPSIIPTWSGGRPGNHVDKVNPVPIHLRLQPRQPLTDKEFLTAALPTAGEMSGLTNWGHDVKLRLIYLMLMGFIQTGARRDTDAIFEAIKSIEKTNFHLTINYFWVQMISNCIATVNKRMNLNNENNNISGLQPMSFDEFYRQPECQKLRNSLLYEKFYSPSVIDNESAAVEFVMPNIKNFTSVV